MANLQPAQVSDCLRAGVRRFPDVPAMLVATTETTVYGNILSIEDPGDVVGGQRN